MECHNRKGSSTLEEVFFIIEVLNMGVRRAFEDLNRASPARRANYFVRVRRMEWLSEEWKHLRELVNLLQRVRLENASAFLKN